MADVRSRTWLWATVLFFTLFVGFVYAPWQVLAPQISRTSLGGAGAWAAINAALGLGSIGGALLGLRWRPRHPLRAALLLFLVGGPAMYALVAAHAPLPVILAVAVIDGSSGTVFNTLWYTAIQREISPDEQSRVISWDYLGTLAIQPLGLALPARSPPRSASRTRCTSRRASGSCCSPGCWRCLSRAPSRDRRLEDLAPGWSRTPHCHRGC